jgi:molecular chaperone DnaK
LSNAALRGDWPKSRKALYDDRFTRKQFSMISAGIDLGTTYSAIAHLNTEGIPTIFPDAYDADLFRTPSLVHIGPVGCLVGGTVENLLEDQPDLAVIRHSKLAFGSRQPIFHDHLNRDWTAEAINALILAKLRADVTAHAYDDINDVVITVPAQFGDVQRRAVRRAAELTDLRVSSLVDEPVAAATYLSTQQDQEQKSLIYDLGGGTFDATILRCSPNEITVLATNGHDRVGGKWVDELIIGLMKQELQNTYGSDFPDSSSINIQLRRLAEETKLKLCKPGRTQVRLNTLIGSKPFDFVLTEHHFEKLIQPLLQQSLDVCEQCLQAANFQWADLDQILLVGGSTLIPSVRTQLANRAEISARDIQSRQPHQAVVFGAAILAGEANEQHRGRIPTLRQAITAYDLGVRIRDPRTGQLAIYKLIQRNSPLPTQATKVFKTSRDDQSRIVIEVVQSKGNAANALSLGHFSFGPLVNPSAGYPIEVSMQYDHEGIVTVKAKDAQTGQEMAQTLRHDSDYVDEPSYDAERVLVSSVQVNGV